MQVLITGIFGQDGSYLAETYHERGMTVHGICSKNLSPQSKKIKSELLVNNIKIKLWDCDLTSYKEVRDVIAAIKPDFLYHLAAKHSSSQGLVNNLLIEGKRKVFNDNVLFTINILSAIQDKAPECRYVGAGSCLMYDASTIEPQDSDTPWQSNSAYGLAKITGANWVKFCRETYGMHASTAILYNHESPRRGDQFVSQKIVKGLSEIACGKKNTLKLSSLDVVKDWGDARDTIKALMLIAESQYPDDYIIATGFGRTVRNFVETVSKRFGIVHWNDHVVIDNKITNTNSSKISLIGNSEKIKKRLKWGPKISFEQMIDNMIANIGSNK